MNQIKTIVRAARKSLQSSRYNQRNRGAYLIYQGLYRLENQAKAKKYQEEYRRLK